MMMGVYLLCFERPYEHAQHYIGYSSNIEKRVAEHNAGRSTSSLTTAAANVGIKMELVRVWPGKDRNYERWLKSGRRAKRLCPRCNPAVEPGESIISSEEEGA